MKANSVPTWNKVRAYYSASRYHEDGVALETGMDEFDDFADQVKSSAQSEVVEKIRATIGAFSEEGVSALDAALSCIQKAENAPGRCDGRGLAEECCTHGEEECS